MCQGKRYHKIRRLRGSYPMAWGVRRRRAFGGVQEPEWVNHGDWEAGKQGLCRNVQE